MMDEKKIYLKLWSFYMGSNKNNTSVSMLASEEKISHLGSQKKKLFFQCVFLNLKPS